MKKLIVLLVLLLCGAVFGQDAQVPPFIKPDGPNKLTTLRADSLRLTYPLWVGNRPDDPFSAWIKSFLVADSVADTSQAAFPGASWLSVPQIGNHPVHGWPIEIYLSLEPPDSAEHNIVGSEISINVPGHLEYKDGATGRVYGLIINGKPVTVGDSSGSIRAPGWVGLYVDLFDVTAGMVDSVTIDDTVFAILVPSIDAPADADGTPKFGLWAKNNIYTGDSLFVMDRIGVGTVTPEGTLEIDVATPTIYLDAAGGSQHQISFEWDDNLVWRIETQSDSDLVLARRVGVGDMITVDEDAQWIKFFGGDTSYYIPSERGVAGQALILTDDSTLAWATVDTGGSGAYSDSAKYLVLVSGDTVGIQYWVSGGGGGVSDTLISIFAGGDTLRQYRRASDSNFVIQHNSGGAALMDSAYVDNNLYFNEAATIFINAIRWDSAWQQLGRFAPGSGSTDSFFVAEAALTTTGWKQSGDTIFVDTSSGGAGSGTADSMGVDTDGNGSVDSYLYSTTAGAFHLKKGANITLTVDNDTVTIAGDAGAGTADSIGVDTDGDGTVDGYMYSTTAGAAHFQKGYGLTFTLDTDTLLVLVDTTAITPKGFVRDSTVHPTDFAKVTDDTTGWNAKRDSSFIAAALNMLFGYFDRTYFDTLPDASGDSIKVLFADSAGSSADEKVQDKIGAMLTGNTETGITVTYEDGDGTIDFVVTSSGGSDTSLSLSQASGGATYRAYFANDTLYIVWADGDTCKWTHGTINCGTGPLEADSIWLVLGGDTALLTVGFIDSVRAGLYGGSGSVDSAGVRGASSDYWSASNPWKLVFGTGLTVASGDSAGVDTVVVRVDFGAHFDTAAVVDTAQALITLALGPHFDSAQVVDTIQAFLGKYFDSAQTVDTAQALIALTIAAYFDTAQVVDTVLALLAAGGYLTNITGLVADSAVGAERATTAGSALFADAATAAGSLTGDLDPDQLSGDAINNNKVDSNLIGKVSSAVNADSAVIAGTAYGVPSSAGASATEPGRISHNATTDKLNYGSLGGEGNYSSVIATETYVQGYVVPKTGGAFTGDVVGPMFATDSTDTATRYVTHSEMEAAMPEAGATLADVATLIDTTTLDTIQNAYVADTARNIGALSSITVKGNIDISGYINPWNFRFHLDTGLIQFRMPTSSVIIETGNDADSNTIHASALYRASGWGVDTSKYFLFYTPYYGTNVNENPCLVVANNPGDTFKPPTGRTLPLFTADSPYVALGGDTVASYSGYFSDASGFFTFQDSIGVVYRGYNSGDYVAGGDPYHADTVSLFISLSGNGVNWTLPQEILKSHHKWRYESGNPRVAMGFMYLSPSIVPQPDGTYRLWTIEDNVYATWSGTDTASMVLVDSLNTMMVFAADDIRDTWDTVGTTNLLPPNDMLGITSPVEADSVDLWHGCVTALSPDQLLWTGNLHTVRGSGFPPQYSTTKSRRTRWRGGFNLMMALSDDNGMTWNRVSDPMFWPKNTGGYERDTITAPSYTDNFPDGANVCQYRGGPIVVQKGDRVTLGWFGSWMNATKEDAIYYTEGVYEVPTTKTFWVDPIRVLGNAADTSAIGSVSLVAGYQGNNHFLFIDSNYHATDTLNDTVTLIYPPLQYYGQLDSLIYNFRGNVSQSRIDGWSLIGPVDIGSTTDSQTAGVQDLGWVNSANNIRYNYSTDFTSTNVATRSVLYLNPTDSALYFREGDMFQIRIYVKIAPGGTVKLGNFRLRGHELPNILPNDLIGRRR